MTATTTTDDRWRRAATDEDRRRRTTIDGDGRRTTDNGQRRETTGDDDLALETAMEGLAEGTANFYLKRTGNRRAPCVAARERGFENTSYREMYNEDGRLSM